MEVLLARHAKETRDLESRTTQKKKNASKKTRKGVNDECDRLERELQERHANERAELNGELIPSDPLNDTLHEDDIPAGPTPSQPTSIDGVSTPDPTASVTSSLAHTTLDNASPTAASQPRKRNRQKERLARRAAERDEAAAQAAEEAALMPDLRGRERDVILVEARRRGLAEREVRADGHCLYAAIADQLGERGLHPRVEILGGARDEGAAEGKVAGYRAVRRVAGEYIERNKDDFEPFLEEPLAEYVRKVKDTGEWGGHLELMALAKAYEVTINVVQGDGRVEKIESGQPKENGAEKAIWLAYYRHGFGLGEHYNSLRKAES